MVKKLNNFSVIIRTRNEEQWIGYTIQSVLDNLFKPEIIIIDNNSSDKTLEIVNQFSQDPLLNSNSSKYTKIKIFNIDNYSPGKALNLGVKKSSKKNILIISAHCILKKFNEEQILNSLKKNVCVFGNQIPIYQGKKITKRYIWSHFLDTKNTNMFSKLENRYFLHNALAVYRSEILKKYPFDPNLTGKEDRYWANMIVKKKLNYLYEPMLVAEHQYTTNGNTWKGIG
ncbi:glycosyltransferase [bacterium]|nr:glycosyltransferase [bacterium]